MGKNFRTYMISNIWESYFTSKITLKSVDIFKQLLEICDILVKYDILTLKSKYIQDYFKKILNGFDPSSLSEFVKKTASIDTVEMLINVTGNVH